MFVKISLRDRLICFTDFVGLTLLSLFFLLPLPNCFLRVCYPTLFAAVLILLLPLTTSTIFDRANSNKSAPTRFAARTIYLRKNGIAVLPITCATAPNPVHVFDQHLYRMESLLVLKQPSSNVFLFRNECWRVF